jgi:hypothetical protein
VSRSGVTGILLALVGLIWIGQGVGLIGGSFMSGSALWGIIGLVAVGVGGALAARAVRRR